MIVRSKDKNNRSIKWTINNKSVSLPLPMFHQCNPFSQSTDINKRNEHWKWEVNEVIIIKRIRNNWYVDNIIKEN